MNLNWTGVAGLMRAGADGPGNIDGLGRALTRLG